MMGLSKKTFLYSIAIAAIMTAFIIGYFVLMLPSLYVDYVMKNNLKSVVDLQEGYRAEGSYDNLTVRNPSSTFSVKIPGKGNEIYAAGKFFQMTITVQDEELQEMLDTFRDMMESMEYREGAGSVFTNTEMSDDEAFRIWEQIREKFSTQNLISESAPVTVQLEGRGSEGVYREEYSKIHMLSEESFVFEGGVSDGNYGYTTYVAMSRDKDGFLMTVLPAMTPHMGEIRPVVMESLPMIASVIFLLVLLASRFFSGKIVNPIIRLADYAESIRASEGFEPDEKIPFDSGDEIGALGSALQELYGELSAKYQELSQKNKTLAQENERQEVFLRATSHQLKTPVAAALLLVEGMMNEVGKYKNVKAYLPEVKNQLLSMRKIVEDILYLNYHGENMRKESLSVEDLLRELLGNYQVQIEERGLQVSLRGSGRVCADREMMKKIVDNILSNAVQYTPEGERIEIGVDERELLIRNYGTVIDQKLLLGIFEPFVSSDESRKGKGLGLYVAAYYSRLSGFKLEVENMENAVQTKLIYVKERVCC
ncbi:MAG: HAMP domain-containing histidine kinase [Lachnospiraceae bacterium]|jgi:signal transduction histidine kinase|nr:HAMP domain-containing histidine kinase [Lachnospiraceae bacterium]